MSWQGVAPLQFKGKVLCQFVNKFDYKITRPELSTPIQTRNIFGEVGRVSKTFEKRMGFHNTPVFVRPSVVQAGGRLIYLSRTNQGKLQIMDVPESVYKNKNCEITQITLTARELRSLGTFLGTSKDKSINWTF